ncbi:hypothetical protein Vadar_012168 [Vaccinium darrowii]|uniref:Uncharacterized protein n=1 Tax=Vaccinium darrowii TaxID=229202 RepID=A0ACB7X086_9ERIC|nr:hypothetical protein Vadar_012168 [Vaccinium darrowii]
MYACGCSPFERKVLPRKNSPPYVSYPKADYWSKSFIPLCFFKVCNSGLIEDHSSEGREVDFAYKYLGGGALNRGCVQEEIHLMINPELIAGMLFLPSMADNEAIEIVGVERFSNYAGAVQERSSILPQTDNQPFSHLRLNNMNQPTYEMGQYGS